MELHELHVAHHGPSPVGHCKSIAGGHQRVGRVSEDLAGPAARQHHSASEADSQLAFFSKGDRAHAAPSIHEQIQNELVFVQFDPASGGDHLSQSAGHHAAGRVAPRVDDTGHRVRPFLPQDQLAVALVELGSQLLQLPYPGGTLLHQHPHGLVVAEADPGFQGVLEMQIGRIVRTHGRRDTPLREKSRGLVESRLGDEADIPSVGGPQCGGKARDPTPDHQHVIAGVAKVGPSPRDERLPRVTGGGRAAPTWTPRLHHASPPVTSRPRPSAARPEAPSLVSQDRRSPRDPPYAGRSAPCPRWSVSCSGTRPAR